MTPTKSGHLIDILTEVPDPRNAKGKRHPLGAILTLAVDCDDVWVSEFIAQLHNGGVPMHRLW